jgi:hypothetical protein
VIGCFIPGFMSIFFFLFSLPFTPHDIVNIVVLLLLQAVCCFGSVQRQNRCYICSVFVWFSVSAKRNYPRNYNCPKPKPIEFQKRKKKKRVWDYLACDNL